MSAAQVAFLHARYDEAEQVARVATMFDHIARNDPASVLADIAMKRRLLELHSFDLPRPHECIEWSRVDPDYPDDPKTTRTGFPEVCQVLHLLTSAYATHLDYREEWTP